MAINEGSLTARFFAIPVGDLTTVSASVAAYTRSEGHRVMFLPLLLLHFTTASKVDNEGVYPRNGMKPASCRRLFLWGSDEHLPCQALRNIQQVTKRLSFLALGAGYTRDLTVYGFGARPVLVLCRGFLQIHKFYHRLIVDITLRSALAGVLCCFASPIHSFNYFLA